MRHRNSYFEIETIFSIIDFSSILHDRRGDAPAFRLINITNCSGTVHSARSLSRFTCAVTVGFSLSVDQPLNLCGAPNARTFHRTYPSCERPSITASLNRRNPRSSLSVAAVPNSTWRRLIADLVSNGYARGCGSRQQAIRRSWNSLSRNRIISHRRRQTMARA